MFHNTARHGGVNEIETPSLHNTSMTLYVAGSIGNSIISLQQNHIIRPFGQCGRLWQEEDSSGTQDALAFECKECSETF